MKKIKQGRRSGVMDGERPHSMAKGDVFEEEKFEET